MEGTATDFLVATGILQSMYKGFISQIEREVPPLMQILKPKSDLVSGQDVKFSAQVENPQGVGSRALASATLPPAVPGKYLEMTVGTGRIYATLMFDRKMLLAAGQNSAGRNRYINYLEQEMKGIKTTFLMDLSRQLFGKKTGFITVCGTTAGVVVLQLGISTNMEYLVEGMHIDIVTTATGVAIANGADRIIQSVDVDNATVTLDTAGGVVTTDNTMSITRQGSYNAEMTGLAAIVSATEDIYGITTATQRRWKAYVTTATAAGAAAFDIKTVIKVASAAKIRSGAKVNLLVSNADLLNQYWYQLTRVATPTYDHAKAPTPPSVMAVGPTKLQVVLNGKACDWIADDNCPSGYLYGLDTDNIGIQHLGPAEFMNINGEILLPNIYGASGTATNKAVLEYYPEVIATRRNPHWLITGFSSIAGW